MDAVWNVAGQEDRHPPLSRAIEADVAVIGGGITGLMTALRLADAGQSVAVLEAGRIGRGNTGGSTGNLYGTLSQGLSSVRRKWGDEVLRDVVRARMEAVDEIQRTVERFGIDCQFERCPHHLVAPGSQGELERQLEQERDACTAAGLEATLTTEVALPFSVHRALRIERQAQFNPLRYVQELARALDGLGVAVHEQSRVVATDPGNGLVRTADAEVRAQHIVHATHTPMGVSVLQAQMVPYREYGISARLTGHGYPEGTYWVLDPFRSLRSYRYGGDDYLVVVGCKHKTGHGERDDYHEQLRAYARERFDVAGFEHAWSAQQYVPADELPYIGRPPGAGNVYVGTGYAANGLVWGVVAARLITDRVLERDNPLAARFDARRFTPGKSARRWVEENMMVAQHLVRDRLAPERVRSLDEIRPGEARVVSFQGEKLAVHRSEAGKLAAVSAVCPHMKCLVRWNAADGTWDCPCHGSRFRIDGGVIEGPAYHPLPRRQPS